MKSMPWQKEFWGFAKFLGYKSNSYMFIHDLSRSQVTPLMRIGWPRLLVIDVSEENVLTLGGKDR